MTDEIEENRSFSRRNSIIPPPTILEESNNSTTISTLVNSTPLVDPNVTPLTPNIAPPRQRRRSSFSIVQTLIGSNALLSTTDVRKR